MKTDRNEIIAEEGMFLTQADENIELQDRIVATKISLSKHSSPGDWKEITETEADKIRRDKEEESLQGVSEEESPDDIEKFILEDGEKYLSEIPPSSRYPNTL